MIFASHAAKSMVGRDEDSVPCRRDNGLDALEMPVLIEMVCVMKWPILGCGLQ